MFKIHFIPLNLHSAALKLLWCDHWNVNFRITKKKKIQQ